MKICKDGLICLLGRDQITAAELVDFSRQHKILQLLNIDTLKQDMKKDEYLYLDKTVRREKLHLFAQYSKIINNFKTLHQLLNFHQIDFLMVKGLDISSRYYEKPWLRKFSDIDIIIDQNKLATLYKLMADLGYRWSKIEEKTKPSKTIFATLSIISYFDEAVLMEGEIGSVDIHPLESRVFKSILEKSQKKNVNNLSYQALSDKQNLIYLLEHGEKHLWRSAQWIIDIYALVKDNSLEYNMSILDELKFIHLDRSFMFCLLSLDLMGLLNLKNAISANTANEFRHSISYRLLRYKHQTPINKPIMHEMLNLLTKVSLKNSNFEVVRTILNCLFKPTINDLKCIALPYSMKHFYYILRPLRILTILLKNLSQKERRP